MGSRQAAGRVETRIGYRHSAPTDFLAADPAGLFLVEDDGLPAAAISVVNHGGAQAFLGLHLSRPDYRGRGIGHALWTEALAHAAERTVGLDGAPAQQENYVRSGFVHAGETARCGGPVQPGTSPGLAVATEADIPALVDRDAAASGMAKPAYMSAWFGNTPTRCTLMLGPGGADGFEPVANAGRASRSARSWQATRPRHVRSSTQRQSPSAALS